MVKKANEEKQMFKDFILRAFAAVKFDGITKLQSHFFGTSIQFWSKERGITIKHKHFLILKPIIPVLTY